MYRVAICDDEPEVCSALVEILHQAPDLPELELVTYYSGEPLCEAVRNDMPFDLYILDIELPHINGVEVGQRLRKELGQEDAQLLYISGKERYAMQLFDLRPLNFLVKPFSAEKVVECVKVAASLAERAAPFFEFRHKKLLYRVPYREIRYFESRNKKIVIHAGGQELVMSGPLSEICKEKGLPETFIQIHQSFVVNYEHVQRIGYLFNEKRTLLRNMLSSTYALSKAQAICCDFCGEESRFLIKIRSGLCQCERCRNSEISSMRDAAGLLYTTYCALKRSVCDVPFRYPVRQHRQWVHQHP